MRLNVKFSVVMIVLIAIPMLIFNFVFFEFMKQGAIIQIENETKNKLFAQESGIQKIAELCSMTSQLVLGDEQFQNFIADIRAGKKITTEEYLSFQKSKITIYENMINSNPYIEQLHVYVDSNDFPEMLPIMYHKDQLKSNLWDRSTSQMTWFFEGDSYARILKNVQNLFGEKIGVLEIVIDIKELFPEIYAEQKDRVSFFVSHEEEILVGEEVYFTEEQIKDILKNSEETKRLTIDGEEYLLNMLEIKEISGVYVVLNNIDHSLDYIREQQVKILLSMILLFTGMILLINLTVYMLLRRFYNTIQFIRNIRGDNLNHRICQENSTDEIGELNTQINRMLDKIETLMKENVDREVLIKNTEIKALQNQINSHFIYNVLESIKMMAEIDEEYLISDAVTSLGELLRYNMKWVSHNVTVRDEINYIKNYIQLMNLRYDFEIILNIKIEEQLYEQEIPKMSLQPIVENAICHGIVENGEDAVIYIKAIEKEDSFEISITDSGVGMNEQQLIALEKRMNGEIEKSGGAGNGIGLKNVQDRIKIQCGEEYGLQFYAKEGCYTKVCVTLPMNRGK